MICCQVSFVFGQPIASAIGRGMAITVGVRAMLGCRSGRIGSAAGSAAATPTQALDSGTHTSGGMPFVFVSHSVASRSAVVFESTATTCARAHVPSTSGVVSAHFLASVVSRAAVELDAWIVAVA
jgi:hypothetical protein